MSAADNELTDLSAEVAADKTELNGSALIREKSEKCPCKWCGTADAPACCSFPDNGCSSSLADVTGQDVKMQGAEEQQLNHTCANKKCCKWEGRKCKRCCGGSLADVTGQDVKMQGAEEQQLNLTCANKKCCKWE